MMTLYIPVLDKAARVHVSILAIYLSYTVYFLSQKYADVINSSQARARCVLLSLANSIAVRE